MILCRLLPFRTFLLLPVLLSFVPHRAAAQFPSEIVRALTDEMSRTMRRLDMMPLGLPYFASYTVRDTRRIEVEGSFGSLKNFADVRSRRVSVDLRVGSRELDNAHFAARDTWTLQPISGYLVGEDDYDALRFDLWTLTDRAYKEAQETLSKKKAFKARRLIKEEVPDLSVDPVSTTVQPLTELPFDRARWEQIVREVSAVFRRYPAIQESQASLLWTQTHVYFVDSQGRDVRKTAHDVEVFIEASAQAPDGMRLRDRRRIIRQDPAALPAPASLEAQAAALAKDLTALSAAPVWEGVYTGPVLLEGQAAGEFFNQLLARNLSSTRSLWLEEEERMKEYFDEGAFASRLGLRVTAPLLSVRDDPTIREHDRVPLAGFYKTDDEGIRARRVELVSRGILKDLLMSRSPTKDRAVSNGHGRSSPGELVTARIGSLFVEPSETVAPSRLKAELLRSARAFGLDYGIVIRRLQDDAHRAVGDVLAPPILVYKVHARDGREELVRSAQFANTTLRALRDVALAGSTQHVYNFYQLGPYRFSRGETPASIVHPDVLVAELELKKTEEKPEKPPTLGHPYFDK